MLKFKNHFDLLVDKKKPHQKASDIVCMRKMFLMEYLLQVYIHTCAVDEMAVFYTLSQFFCHSENIGCL